MRIHSWSCDKILSSNGVSYNVNNKGPGPLLDESHRLERTYPTRNCLYQHTVFDLWDMNQTIGAQRHWYRTWSPAWTTGCHGLLCRTLRADVIKQILLVYERLEELPKHHYVHAEEQSQCSGYGGMLIEILSITKIEKKCVSTWLKTKRSKSLCSKQRLNTGR